MKESLTLPRESQLISDIYHAAARIYAGDQQLSPSEAVHNALDLYDQTLIELGKEGA